MKSKILAIAKKIPWLMFVLCFINRIKFQFKYAALPVQDNKIVFNNYMGKGFGCNCRPVAELLLKLHAPYELVWIVSDPQKQRKEFPDTIRLVEHGSEQMLEEYATAKFWVCNYHLVDLFGHGLRKKPEQVYIQMWHGSFGIKKQEREVEALTKDKVWLYFSKMNSEATDYWISNCKFENDVYRSSFWNIKEIMEYGHPRNDIFFREHRQVRRQVCEALCIAPSERILLYIPTYREDMSDRYYRVDFEALKDAFERKTGRRWRIVVRLHPKLTEMAEQFVPKADFISDASNYPDITDLLASADAALTDYSSAVFDYMLSYNPAFIFATDIEQYNTDRGFYYSIFSTPFPVAVNNEELIANVEHFDYVDYRQKVDAFLKDKGSFEDGKAAERVVRLIANNTD